MARSLTHAARRAECGRHGASRAAGPAHVRIGWVVGLVEVLPGFAAVRVRATADG